jgi:mannose-6-phosphate isomerase-like protein (cupin superfamily)
MAGVIQSNAWAPEVTHDFDLEGATIASPSTLILTNMPPGKGPRLHKHPYVEVWVVFEGTARFTAGDDLIDAGPGDIVHVEADMPHKFVVTGDTPAKMVCIHLAPKFTTIWLEPRT